MFLKIPGLKHDRTRKIVKNVVASLGLRGAMIVLNFVLVPLVLAYLNPVRYGIWLTLTSVIAWISLFDIGFGNGLRNKFTEAVAKSDKESARIYVSTTYAIITAIMLVLFVLFLIINPFLSWTKILNAPPEMAEELRLLVIFVFGFFGINFVLKLITTILTADHKPALNSLLNVISVLLSLIIVYILIKTKSVSLLNFGIAYSIIPVFVFLVASIILFKGLYKEYAPSFKFVKLEFLKVLGGVGVQFFILQVAFIIIFSTNNLIITQLFGPAEVTTYNIAYKYFMVMNMVFGIIMQPFWSGFTEAYHKEDYGWIKAIVKKLVGVWGLVTIGVILMLVFSHFAYKIWLRREMNIPVMLSASMAFYVVLMNWVMIFTFFINGVGKIRFQLYRAIVGAIINIPLSIFLAKNLGLGVSGVVLASCFGPLISSVLTPMQYHKIISKTATGIWNR